MCLFVAAGDEFPLVEREDRPWSDLVADGVGVLDLVVEDSRRRFGTARPHKAATRLGGRSACASSTSAYAQKKCRETVW